DAAPYTETADRAEDRIIDPGCRRSQAEPAANVKAAGEMGKDVQRRAEHREDERRTEIDARAGRDPELRTREAVEEQRRPDHEASQRRGTERELREQRRTQDSRGVPGEGN